MTGHPDAPRKPIPVADVHIIGTNTSERIVRAGRCPELHEHGIALVGLTLAAPPYNVTRTRWNGSPSTYFK